MTEKPDPLAEITVLSESVLRRLARERRCPLCQTSLYVREDGEDVTNGMHNACLAANVTGHQVRACRCYPDTEGLTDREVAVLAFTRLRERQAGDS